VTNVTVGVDYGHINSGDPVGN